MTNNSGNRNRDKSSGLGGAGGAFDSLGEHEFEGEDGMLSGATGGPLSVDDEKTEALSQAGMRKAAKGPLGPQKAGRKKRVRGGVARAPSKSRGLAEAREQKKWVVWARGRGLEFNHQNNGASKTSRRIHLHAMGCTAGAADVLVFNRLPRDPQARGLALEFKAKDGRQSPTQGEWGRRMVALGYRYHVVHSSEMAIEICKSYGL